MVQFAVISRVKDGLPLCASMDSGKVLPCPSHHLRDLHNGPSCVKSSDALPFLCPFVQSDEELLEYQKQAKNIVKKMSPDSPNPLPTKASIKTGPYIFQ